MDALTPSHIQTTSTYVLWSLCHVKPLLESREPGWKWPSTAILSELGDNQSQQLNSVLTLKTVLLPHLLL